MYIYDETVLHRLPVILKIKHTIMFYKRHSTVTDLRHSQMRSLEA